MHRLGGFEAPPAIISVYLGETVDKIINAIESEGQSEDLPAKNKIDLGLPKLPEILAFDSDRNRTSPLAFTGDKFEFRAPGASQAMSVPVTALLSVWAAGLEEFMTLLEKRINNGEEPITAAVSVIRELSIKSRKIRYEGDSYKNDWKEEAQKRGIVKGKTIPEGIDLFVEPKTLDMLENISVFKRREMEAFHTIRKEAFVKSNEVEMFILRDMIWEGVLPSISKQLLLEKSSYDMLVGQKIENMEKWSAHITKLAEAKVFLIEKTQELVDLKEKLSEKDVHEHALGIVSEVVPLMEEIRKMADSIEIYLSADNQFYPNYRSLFSLSS
jgi:glutamine synthetase